MRLFLIIGGVGAVLMCVIAPFLSAAQNSKEITSGYFALAPSVFLVSAISVFRGWFQGKNQMFPTAASEVTEQLVKVGFGLFFAYRYRGNVEKAVVFLLLAVTLSEAVALLLIWWLYRRNKNKQKQGKDGGRVETKQVLKLSIPVTLSAMLLPLSNLLDSVLVVRLLGVYAPDPVALYGLFSGGAVTVINLPVSVCYGIAAASIPAVAAVNSGKRKKIFFALGITVLLAAPAAVGLYVFARPLSQFIFRSLKGNELDTLVKLIRIFSISALTLSCTQTLSACLTAQGKPQYAALSMLVSVVVKTGVYTFLLQDAKMSVFGLAHAGNICYLVAFLLDLLYNLRVSKSARRKQT
jgi:stage V sporulation protein B